jgi:hypothetical protein
VEVLVTGNEDVGVHIEVTPRERAQAAKDFEAVLEDEVRLT